jgi:hypothetical protein
MIGEVRMLKKLDLEYIEKTTSKDFVTTIKDHLAYNACHDIGKFIMEEKVNITTVSFSTMLKGRDRLHQVLVFHFYRETNRIQIEFINTDTLRMLVRHGVVPLKLD